MLRYITLTTTDPAFNLAAEQYVFDYLPKDRNYLMLWQNDNAVIIGKYQNTLAEINLPYVEQHHIRVVRRLSGGGAVYHDLGNLNYSFISDAGSSESLNLRLFCEPVVRALEELGVRAEINGRNDMTVDGKKFSAQRTVTESPYNAVIYGMKRDRTELYNRIDLRVDMMIRQGLVEETAALLAKGYPETLPSMSAIGYKEICDYLHGKTNLEEAAQLIKFRTHNYVRRQANWFKPNDPQIRWITPDEIESVVPELDGKVH